MLTTETEQECTKIPECIKEKLSHSDGLRGGRPGGSIFGRRKEIFLRIGALSPGPKRAEREPPTGNSKNKIALNMDPYWLYVQHLTRKSD
jgi:hypothetical protein